MKSVVFVSLTFLALTGCSSTPADQPRVSDIQAALKTAQVTDDPDDPAIWLHPSDPERSFILGTNKVLAPKGALVVFGLDGAIRQTLTGLDRPNNVDIEYALDMGGGSKIDIAVVTERLKHQLRIFQIAPDGSGLTDVTATVKTQVMVDRKGEQAAPMGVSLYRRPRDGAIFAIVAPKNGPRDGYLAQYRLEAEGADGRVKASFIRYFGRFSGTGEIEAVAVDDELGYIYYADEGNGIHKYPADPDQPDASREFAHFGKTGFRADREGIAIYARQDGTGYLVCTDQIAGNSEYHIFRREGEPGRPHDHGQPLKIVRGGADSTDGLEITSRPAGAKFPMGLMVAMNSSARNFLVFRWEDVAASGMVKLNQGR